MNKLLLIAFILFSQSVLANCKLVTFDRIIKINPNQDQKIIKETDCSEEVQNTFVKFVSSTTGKLNSAHLKRYFKQESNVEIEISPEIFSVTTIESLIEDNIKDGTVIVKNITSLFSQSSLNLSISDSISIECKDCNKPGEKNILATINDKKIWLSALIHKKRSAYVLVKNLTNLDQTLDASFFKKVVIADNGNSLLFNDIDKIRFYKPTKLLRIGETVKKYDLRSRVLIQFGQKVNVNIKSNSIKLESRATARRNGHIGDVIELVNDNSNKVITAKVVDFNKVEVEL